MAQQLTALSALDKDLSLVPNTHRVAHNHDYSASDPVLSSGPYGYCTHVANINTYSYT